MHGSEQIHAVFTRRNKNIDWRGADCEFEIF